jgi:hypothetical protein
MFLMLSPIGTCSRPCWPRAARIRLSLDSTPPGWLSSRAQQSSKRTFDTIRVSTRIVSPSVISSTVAGKLKPSGGAFIRLLFAPLVRFALVQSLLFQRSGLRLR